MNSQYNVASFDDYCKMEDVKEEAKLISILFLFVHAATTVTATL